MKRCKINWFTWQSLVTWRSFSFSSLAVFTTCVGNAFNDASDQSTWFNHSSTRSSNADVFSSFSPSLHDTWWIKYTHSVNYTSYQLIILQIYHRRVCIGYLVRGERQKVFDSVPLGEARIEKGKDTSCLTSLHHQLAHSLSLSLRTGALSLNTDGTSFTCYLPTAATFVH